ncbi:MAG: hypothetical protein KDC05_08565 [Bacteroidales bacterium]|nr:hypothetical protein [Bacteroidales bacterium]
MNIYKIRERFFCLLLLLIFMISVTGVKAQVTRALYFQEKVPSSSVLNPAYHPDCNFYINLPLISTLYIGFESPFSFNQLTSPYDSGDSLFIDREAVMDELKDRNYFSFELYNEVGRAGFRTGRHFFHLSIAKVFSTKFSFDKDIVALFFYGNANERFFGKEANFSQTGLNMTSYHEFALGYSTRIGEKITVGTRLKYLNGAFNVWTEKADVSLYTDANPNYTLTAASDIVLHTSSTISDFDNLIDQIEGYKWFDLSENHGYGFDLGLEFDQGEKYKLMASVTDFGWITWKENVKNFVSANPGEDYEFSGFDLDDFISDGSFSDSLDFTDTLTTHFKLLENHDPYTSHLNPKLYLGGIWRITKSNELGLMLRTDFAEERIQPSLTLNYSHHFGKIITAYGSYSLINRNATDLGLGIIMKFGSFQIYGATDIFMGFVEPAQTRNYNFQLGINFIFGKGKTNDTFEGIEKQESNTSEE